jgi:uncharacterized membrane protein
MTSSFWSFDLSWGPVVTGAVALLISLVLAWRSVRRERAGVGYAVLEGVRLLAALLLIATLFRPERVRLTRRTDLPVVAVLCDASGSMATRDVVGTNATAQSRGGWLEAQRAAQFWQPLEPRYRVAVTEFDAVATNRAAGTNDAAAHPDPGTDLNRALEEAARMHGNLRAVLMLSDGDWNLGGSPVSAASALAVREIPVYAVTVGSENFLPDIELLSVAAPSYGLVDEHVALPVTLRSRLPREVRTRIDLKGPRGVMASKDVTIPAMAQIQETVMLVPLAAGEYDFTVSVPVEKDEVFQDNNAREFRMAIRREILKVLVVDTRPRWEYRYLRNALARDPGVAVSCLLLHPGMTPGEGRDYLRAFPATREELSAYDVVFLGDVGIGAGGITEAQAAMIKGLVEQQGSGLIFLPGMLGQEATLVNSPLGDLMPVTLAADAQDGIGSPLESRLELTTRGRDHLLTLLAPDPDANQAVWRQLPGFFWYAAVERAKPGTDVLAVHGVARNRHGRVPLLVTRIQGNGKVLFLGTDSAWRWRRGVEDTYHYRFWGQVVRWMSHQRHLAHAEGIRFFFTPEAPARGERVQLHATVFDRAGLPVTAGPVTVTITDGTGGTETLELNAEPGGWGVFTGSFVPREGGDYGVEVACPGADRRIKSALRVSSPRRECVGRPARAGVLRELAAITHGREGTTAQLDDVLRSIRLLPEPKPEEERFRLWCHPVWAALIVGLLTLYWTGRKLLGMV